MTVTLKRVVFWSVFTALLLIALVYAFWPKPVLMDVTEAMKQDLMVSIREEGKTRVHDVFTLSAPVTGRLRRITLEVGDSVTRSETIAAEIEPIDPSFLDPRSEAQARADIQTAQSAIDVARAEVSQAQAELDFARAELDRMRELRLNSTVSRRELDNAERLFTTRRAALATAEAALQMRTFEFERVQAQMLSPTQTQALHGSCECLNITAPINGHVLSVLHRNEGVVTAGTPLLEIGDPENLEIVVELLSTDAVRVEPGQTVLITNWGQDDPLAGRVNRVEPIGFTKVSALGIEEQRVNVLVDLVTPRERWARLGHGYQLDVDIVLWQGQDVLAIPLTALVRDGDHWAVYQLIETRARKTRVTLGRQNPLRAEITAGLEPGSIIITHPNDAVHDGARVEARSML